MDNYTDWQHHIPDYTFADDGFGFLIRTELDPFFFNLDQIMQELH